MVSLSSNERTLRIQNFKHRISALRATTKSYSIRDQKSVGTLDSSLCSSAQSSVGVERRVDEDDSSARNANNRDVYCDGYEQQSCSSSVDGDLFRSLMGEKEDIETNDDGRDRTNMNLFDDDSSAHSGQENAGAFDQNTTSKQTNTSDNPYGVALNPFDDSSIDESFIGTVDSNNNQFEDQSIAADCLSLVRSTGKGDEGRGNTGWDCNGTVASGNSVSLDGDLFRGFHTLIHRKGRSYGNKGLKQKISDISKPQAYHKNVPSYSSSSFGGFSTESIGSSTDQNITDQNIGGVAAVAKVDQTNATKSNKDTIKEETSDRNSSHKEEVKKIHCDITPQDQEPKSNHIQPKKEIRSETFRALKEQQSKLRDKKTKATRMKVDTSDSGSVGDADEPIQNKISQSSTHYDDGNMGSFPVSTSDETAPKSADKVSRRSNIDDLSPDDDKSTPTVCNGQIVVFNFSSTPLDSEQEPDNLFDTDSAQDERSIHSLELSGIDSSSESTVTKADLETPDKATISSLEADQHCLSLTKKNETSKPNEMSFPKKKWQIGVSSFDSKSIDSSHDSPPYERERKSTNPFADILALRAKEKKANNWVAQQMMRPNSNISEMDFESSSQESSVSGLIEAVNQGKVVIENTVAVKTNPFDDSIVSDKEYSENFNYAEDSSVESSSDSGSLGETIFTDLRKALSNIQSVSYDTAEDHRDADEESVYADEVTLTKEPHVNADFDINESCNKEDVISVPKRHRSTENPDEIADEIADEEIDIVQKVTKEVASYEALQRNGPSSDSVTAETSIHGVINLSSPKMHVMLSDGSISTKDSIVGKMIRVTNSDMVAERIYLESLRAQVHAELKVHVADEEIRLAFEARLNAVRDFYERKTATSQLKHSHESASEAVASLSSNPICLNKLGRPKILHDGSVDQKSPQYRLTDVSSLSDTKWIGSEGNDNVAAADTSTSNLIDMPTDDSSETSTEKVTSVRSSTSHNQDVTKERDHASEAQETVERNVEEENIDNLSALGTTPTNVYSHHIPSSYPAKFNVDVSFPAVEDAWIFYRLINNLMSDNRVYDYEFDIIQKDPLYPYLDSLTGIADSGDDGSPKTVKQRVREEFKDISPHRICHILAKEANEVQPDFIDVCEDIARKLGMHNMAVGPIKTASAALIKSEKRYSGNPLLVTDFCRASLFVPDIATLLALIEIVLSKYANIVKRIKLSNLKSDHASIIGGYRDCKVNVDIDGHICEIQVHLETLWNIKEESGYVHYRKCFEHNINDSTYDITRTLIGLDREFLSNLIKVGENAVKESPVSTLEYDREKEIRDYCALSHLYIYYGLPVRAEYTLRQIVKLRTENLLFGPEHAEMLIHLKMLKKSLKMQHKYKSAMGVTKRIKRIEKIANRDEDIVGFYAGDDQCGAIDHIFDTILDPSKKERTNEKQQAQRVDDSRSIWLSVRKTFFKQ